MRERISVEQYLRMPETMKPMELVYGVVREPPAPTYGHQSIVTRLTSLLDRHVCRHRLGRVCVSPVDVVLDRDRDLVVQPDIIFVSNDRQEIIRDRVWGAPDLVVEVLSPGTARYDRTRKLRWYRRYRVRECWFIDPVAREIVIHQLASTAARSRQRIYRADRAVQSTVLPALDLLAGRVFE